MTDKKQDARDQYMPPSAISIVIGKIYTTGRWFWLSALVIFIAVAYFTDRLENGLAIYCICAVVYSVEIYFILLLISKSILWKRLCDTGHHITGTVYSVDSVGARYHLLITKYRYVCKKKIWYSFSMVEKTFRDPKGKRKIYALPEKYPLEAEETWLDNVFWTLVAAVITSFYCKIFTRLLIEII